jgi:hypothetical protein
MDENIQNTPDTDTPAPEATPAPEETSAPEAETPSEPVEPTPEVAPEAPVEPVEAAVDAPEPVMDTYHTSDGAEVKDEYRTQ